MTRPPWLVAITPGGLASGRRGQPPLHPHSEGAQWPRSESLGPAPAACGGCGGECGDVSRGLSVEDQVSAAIGGRRSILGGPSRPCGDPRPSLSLYGRGQGHRGPAGKGLKARLLHSKSACQARRLAWLPSSSRSGSLSLPLSSLLSSPFCCK